MPAGKKLDDGFPIIIGMANAPNISLWEKTVTPPGFEAGGANDTTTMRNVRWRTRSPKKLITMSPMTVSAQYDPVILNTVNAQLGVNQVITPTFPDASKINHWGWLDEWKPGEVREGEPPVGTATFIPSNQDANGAEVAPTYVAPP